MVPHYPFLLFFRRLCLRVVEGVEKESEERHQKLHRLSAAKFQHETLSAPSSSHRYEIP